MFESDGFDIEFGFFLKSQNVVKALEDITGYHETLECLDKNEF